MCTAPFMPSAVCAGAFVSRRLVIGLIRLEFSLGFERNWYSIETKKWLVGVRGLSLFIPSSIWLFIDVSQLKEKKGGKDEGGVVYPTVCFCVHMFFMPELFWCDMLESHMDLQPRTFPCVRVPRTTPGHRCCLPHPRYKKVAGNFGPHTAQVSIV